MNKNFIMLIVLLLSACASTADVSDSIIGFGTIESTKETFDNSTTVTASPYRLYNPDASFMNSMNSVRLGARWNSKHKNTVILILQYTGEMSYLNIKRIDINIDDNITSYDTKESTTHDSDSYNEVTRKIYTRSQNSVVVPLSLLDDMVSAKDCKIRIHTSKGYQDSLFSIDRIPGGSGAARMSIRKFLSAIKLL